MHGIERYLGKDVNHKGMTRGRGARDLSTFRFTFNSHVEDAEKKFKKEKFDDNELLTPEHVRCYSRHIGRISDDRHLSLPKINVFRKARIA